MNKFKKIISLTLVFTMLIGFIPYNYNVKAQDDSLEQYIIYEDDNFRVARTEDEKFYYVTKFNKITKNVDFKTIDKTTNMQVEDSEAYEPETALYYSEEEILEAKRLMSEKEKNIELRSLAPLSSVRKNQNTFINYEYTIYSGGRPVKWEIRRPKGVNVLTQWYSKTAYEYSNNEIYLNLFASEVEKINSKELQVIGNVLEIIYNAAVIASAIASGGLLSYSAVKSVVTGIGQGISVVNNIYDIIQYANKAYTLYFKVQS